MAEHKDNLDHILLPNWGETEGYKFPRRINNRIRTPPRQRGQHAAHLKAQLDMVKMAMRQIQARPDAAQYPRSVVLEFQGESQFELATKSLETPTQGLTLLNVREDEDSHTLYATVRVEDERALEKLERKIDAYRTQNTKATKNNPQGNPKNMPLVESISNINLARLRAFWTDKDDIFPQDVNQKIWWELWLVDEARTIPKLRAIVGLLNLAASDKELRFVERVIVLVEASAAELERLLERCHEIAEVRRAIEIAPFFSLQSDIIHDQLQQLTANVTLENQNNVFITLLDTGVNRGHNLLSPFIEAADLLTCDPTWNTNDHRGHGTEMAGISLYGDLTPLLSSPQPTTIYHALESVKILPPSDPPTPPDLYGAITIQAAMIADNHDNNRRRMFCMPVTDHLTIDRGKPSSWSAAVDEICYGKYTGKRQLFFISAGNKQQPGRNYIDDNLLESIHDPGQAWNALTVGAYTEKQTITAPAFAGWSPVAAEGGLCPSSTTSNIWIHSWPIKPEIVFEGGNMACINGSDPDFDSGLSLITTGHQSTRPLTETGETSAAVAQAGRFAAMLQAANPTMWPETVRALMVHSASWTPTMLEICPGFPKAPKKGNNSIRTLVRTYGYGIPSLQRARYSATDALTMIIEQEFEPYIEDDDGKQSRQINYYNLPWPLQALQDMGNENVRFRVTLSYFVEPNPARRDKQPKHRYRSFGLRFAVKAPLESDNNFKTRLNGMREDGEIAESASDAEHWLIGDQRWSGSIHSDIWTGTAAQLADCGLMAVYPVNGWWKDKFDRIQTNHRRIRYSLILSIQTPRQDIDIYTPVLNQIEIIT